MSRIDFEINQGTDFPALQARRECHQAHHRHVGSSRLVIELFDASASNLGQREPLPTCASHKNHTANYRSYNTSTEVSTMLQPFERYRRARQVASRRYMTSTLIRPRQSHSLLRGKTCRTRLLQRPSQPSQPQARSPPADARSNQDVVDHSTSPVVVAESSYQFPSSEDEGGAIQGGSRSARVVLRGH